MCADHLRATRKLLRERVRGPSTTWIGTPFRGGRAVASESPFYARYRYHYLVGFRIDVLFGTICRLFHHPWPPHPIKLDILQSGIFTAILLASSFTMQKALFDEEKGNRRGARIWLVTSFFMGLVFVLNQAYEWQTVNFTPKTNAYGSMFFLMSGLHGLHVIVGLVAMIGLYGRMAGQRGDPGEAPVFQAVSYYWHFVDVVWVGLYSALFLLK